MGNLIRILAIFLAFALLNRWIKRVLSTKRKVKGAPNAARKTKTPTNQAYEAEYRVISEE